MLRQGFTVDQVVHDYGDLCQAVTELALEKNAPVSTDEFHTLNRCLDDAIADAVTEFGWQRDQLISQMGSRAMSERLGSLAHELRNHLNTAMLSYAGDRVLIEVQDECGGLAEGKAEAMFHSFEQHDADRSGLGLGLSIDLPRQDAVKFL